MYKISFITSVLTYYLKGEVSIDDNFIKITNPNTILKCIPLGANDTSIPVNQLASVDSSFSLDLKSLVINFVIAFVGLGVKESNFLLGVVMVLLGIGGMINAFQTIMTFRTTSGEMVMMNVVVFEKEKVIECKEKVETLLVSHLDNTNIRKHAEQQTDRIIDAINK
ncbi:hypothetical protein SAMN05421767_1252 [Granulicatella balaenopterae]|uniref:Uncharacterized protein n=1 Tax=Granulicatella balaenopterae TaxID=137733 RepID=A0A1H9M8Z9_9LACT|nr:hypothetical protein [Granulicatella balaenopterae]SER19939.1 hypothetical protein SAMN05421767_1252 [Granulicatella balaenopterae]